MLCRSQIIYSKFIEVQRGRLKLVEADPQDDQPKKHDMVDEAFCFEFFLLKYTSIIKFNLNNIDSVCIKLIFFAKHILSKIEYIP